MLLEGYLKIIKFLAQAQPA